MVDEQPPKFLLDIIIDASSSCVMSSRGNALSTGLVRDLSIVAIKKLDKLSDSDTFSKSA